MNGQTEPKVFQRHFCPWFCKFRANISILVLEDSVMITGRAGTIGRLHYSSLSNALACCRISPEELHAMVDLKPEKKDDD
jgi:hypothetical protein